MRILQVIPYFYPALNFGGPAKVVYELSKELSKTNKVTVYTSDAWNKSRRIKENEKLKNSTNFNVFYFKNFINSFAWNFRFFTNFSIIKKYYEDKDDFDVVHIHDVFSLPQIILSLIVNKYSKKYVISTHGVNITGDKSRPLIKKIFYKLFVKNMLASAAVIIATSKEEEKVLKEIGFNNVVVIYNGVSSVKAATSNKFGKYKNKNILTLLYIGRINYLKGLDRIIESLAGNKKPVQLLIAGPDDGEKKKLDSLITSHGLEKSIYFLGLVNEQEKSELYNISDLFVYPSRFEGFSISILEAMQNRLPVLITDACNFNEVKSNKAGFVVNNNSKAVRNFHTILINILKNRRLLNHMGQNAKQLILENYTICLMARKTVNIYAMSLKDNE